MMIFIKKDPRDFVSGILFDANPFSGAKWIFIMIQYVQCQMQ